MRKLTHKAIRRVACILAVVFLFAQFAVAAQACVQPTVAPAMAFSEDMTSPPCTGMNSNVCLAQFLQGDQALGSGDGLVIATAFVSPLVVSAQPAFIPAARLLFVHDSAPPIRTRICRLLI